VLAIFPIGVVMGGVMIKPTTLNAIGMVEIVVPRMKILIGMQYVQNANALIPMFEKQQPQTHYRKMELTILEMFMFMFMYSLFSGFFSH
jgi:hypothetical protein